MVQTGGRRMTFRPQLPSCGSSLLGATAGVLSAAPPRPSCQCQLYLTPPSMTLVLFAFGTDFGDSVLSTKALSTIGSLRRSWMIFGLSKRASPARPSAGAVALAAAEAFASSSG